MNKNTDIQLSFKFIDFLQEYDNTQLTRSRRKEGKIFIDTIEGSLKEMCFERDSFVEYKHGNSDFIYLTNQFLFNQSIFKLEENSLIS